MKRNGLKKCVVELSNPLYAKILRVSNRKHISTSRLIRDVVAFAFDDLEDFFLVRIGEHRLKTLNHKKLVSHKDVCEKLAVNV